MKTGVACVFVLAMGWLLSACALDPAQRTARWAKDAGFQQSLRSGVGFCHRIYTRLPKDTVEVLHVYLGGDGTPWVRNVRIAADPTPRNPLTLGLMALDPAPAVYLGRPCYFGLSRQPGCHPIYWTDARYGKAVLESMAQVLRQLLDELGDPELVFIGYSGGGNLAMLLAPKFAGTRAVVTLAGNLDHHAWTMRHGYTPLKDSLSAATLAPLPPNIRQWHFAAERDRNIPPEIIAHALRDQPLARFRVIPDVDHSCCWERIWPGILERIP